VTSDPTARKPHIVKKLGKKSRWFVAEILVVVVGVLIALGIDQWRDQIESREIELEYIRQIVDELRITEERIAASESRMSYLDDITNQLKAAFDGDEPIQIDRLRQLLAEARFYNTPDPVLGSAMALVSTGGLRSFSNQCVKSAINNYLTDFRDNDLSVGDYMFERYINLNLEIYIEAAAHGIFPTQFGIASDDSTVANLEPDVKGFLANSRAYTLVATNVDIKKYAARSRKRNAKRTEQLREYLETYLATGIIECL
jgi:hypothetical protein